MASGWGRPGCGGQNRTLVRTPRACACAPLPAPHNRKRSVGGSMVVGTPTTGPPTRAHQVLVPVEHGAGLVGRLGQKLVVVHHLGGWGSGGVGWGGGRGVLGGRAYGRCSTSSHPYPTIPPTLQYAHLLPPPPRRCPFPRPLLTALVARGARACGRRAVVRGAGGQGGCRPSWEASRGAAPVSHPVSHLRPARRGPSYPGGRGRGWASPPCQGRTAAPR